MRTALAVAVLTAVVSTAEAQQHPPRRYTEGPVVVLSYVRTKPGMFNQYLDYLDGNYKRLLDAEKKSGYVLDYGVYSSLAATESDWDVLLTVTYRNMAALDSLTEKTETSAAAVLNQSREQAGKAFAERGSMRDPVGTRIVRQLILK